MMRKYRFYVDKNKRDFSFFLRFLRGHYRGGGANTRGTSLDFSRSSYPPSHKKKIKQMGWVWMMLLCVQLEECFSCDGRADDLEYWQRKLLFFSANMVFPISVVFMIVVPLKQRPFLRVVVSTIAAVSCLTLLAIFCKVPLPLFPFFSYYTAQASRTNWCNPCYPTHLGACPL